MSSNATDRYNDFNRSLIADLRANRGKATSGPFMGRQVLILSNTGAKSGDTREAPLAYSRAGDDYVIIASKGGAPTHPSWYHNLVAHHDAQEEVLGEENQGRTRVAEDGVEDTRHHREHARRITGDHD